MTKFDFLLKNCIVTSTFFLKTSYVYQYFLSCLVFFFETWSYRIWKLKLWFYFSHVTCKSGQHFSFFMIEDMNEQQLRLFLGRIKAIFTTVCIPFCRRAEPPTKFSKRGRLDRTSTFRGGLLRKRGGDFFKGGGLQFSHEK